MHMYIYKEYFLFLELYRLSTTSESSYFTRTLMFHHLYADIEQKLKLPLLFLYEDIIFHTVGLCMVYQLNLKLCFFACQ